VVAVLPLQVERVAQPYRRLAEQRRRPAQQIHQVEHRQSAVAADVVVAVVVVAALLPTVLRRDSRTELSISDVLPESPQESGAFPTSRIWALLT